MLTPTSDAHQPGAEAHDRGQALTEAQVADGSGLTSAQVARILGPHALPRSGDSPTLYPADTLYRAQCARHMLDLGVVPRMIALALADSTQRCGPDEVADLAGYVRRHREAVAAATTVASNDVRLVQLPKQNPIGPSIDSKPRGV